MGSMQAREMARLTPDRDTALRWHLQHNHYPPVNVAFVETCKLALDYAAYGDWDYEIKMPNGVTLTVGQIIEDLHLDSFLDTGDEM
ncbi:MAG: hypothetical protein PVF54_09365 [Anaerolineae bacterium]|jgi:hypothetical protein